MSIVCIICTDSFTTERPQASNNGGEGDFSTCALTCGHLFHQQCIKRWFNGSGAAPNRPPGYGECPSCKTPSSLSRALRVFPAGDDESNDLAVENRNLEALIDDNQKLEAKLIEITKKLSDLRCLYEEESDAHETLKMQHAAVLSTVDAQLDQLREHTEMNVALENSVRTALEQKEKEKEEAFELLARLQLKCGGD